MINYYYRPCEDEAKDHNARPTLAIYFFLPLQSPSMDSHVLTYVYELN